jgi:hypothetical protein
MKYITSSGSQTVAAAANGLLIQVNAALTGTITLAAGGTTFAIITNPTVGSQYRYNGLRNQGAITVNPNGSCDITVSFLNKDV